MKTLHLLPLAALLASCSAETTSPSLADSGSPVTDAGSAIDDGGVHGLDATPPLSDVGVRTPDNGQPPAGERPLAPRVSDHTIDQVINGETVERSFHIMAPSRIDEDVNYPIVFAFHGKGGQGRNFVSSMIPFVEAGRFVAILPDGIDRGWNLGADRNGPDDVAFVGMLIDELRGYRGLNLDRMFALGFSNGAGLVHQLARQRSYFSAHAAMATALIEGNEPSAEVHRASFLTLHGLDDPVCPYEGGPGRVRLNFMPAEASAQLWADQLGCPPSPSESGETEAGNRRFVWAPCDEGHRVVHYGVVGSEHSIPRSTEGGLYDLIVRFFEETR